MRSYSLLVRLHIAFYESDTSLKNKRKDTIEEGYSGQNCIFDRSSPSEESAILSSRKASALLVSVSLESDG